MVVAVDGRSLTLASAIEVAERGAEVKASPASLKHMEKLRALLEEKLSRGEVVYGVNTGFGSLSDKVVRPENLEELQLNLIRSHSAGVGSPLPQEVVRAAMLIRLNSLLNGNSAVRKDVAELIIGMLNRGVTPYVPEFGSLGACLAGDSLVYTNPSGPMPISELQPGETVYSFQGDLTKIRVIDKTGDRNNFKYGFQGVLRKSKVIRRIDSGVKQTYKLQTYTREIICTNNHPFLTLTIERMVKGARATYGLRWAELKDLQPGDLILALKKLPDDGQAFPVDLPYLKETTADFMRLVGMIVGDGAVRRDLRGIYIALPPGPEREKYVALINRSLGKSPGRGKDCIIIYNRALNRLLVSWGLARHAKEKRVPNWVFGLPIDQRIAFLEGYLDADATLQEGLRVHKDGHKWHQNTTTFESPNEALIREVRALAISCGMRCGKVRSRDKVRGLWFNGRHLYDYNEPTRNYEFTVMNRGFFPYSYSGKVNINVDNPNFYLDKVISVKPHSRQRVYDIEVEGTHNFVSEGLVVHNSGDLVPSAHMAMTMLGEGMAYRRGRLIDSGKALSASRLKPIKLRAKEGLSLINGTAFTTALACVAVHRGNVLLNAANSTLAVTAEVLRACSQSFDERLVGVKVDPGQVFVAREIRAMWKGSRRIRSEPVPQDPYSIRCAPQVHGSLKDALGFAEKITVDEMNSVSDNPVLLEDGSVLHGGNFHAQPVAMALDLMSLSLSYLGVISLARIHYLLSRTPPESKYMAGKPGLESGLMILEYTATALTNDNAKNVYPESSYPASVSGGIEDHASHGVNAGVKCLQVATNVSRILAVELICASNILGSNESGISEHARRASAFVRAHSPLLRGDRAQGGEIELLAKETLAGKLP
ncbi:MAG: aromatic amino acid lyase [Thaumarchaeota archaeon]|nr:aromatic amino acid lyase [Nitrososphaerota archaeon]